MSKLLLIRAAVLVLMRDFLIPGAGLWTVLVDPSLSMMRPWQFPLVAGMLGTPLVARLGKNAEEGE